jgi:ABC-type sulfate transport system substrate-binding protein
VELVAKSWDDAAERFFAEGGIYDRLAARLP